MGLATAAAQAAGRCPGRSGGGVRVVPAGWESGRGDAPKGRAVAVVQWILEGNRHRGQFHYQSSPLLLTTTRYHTELLSEDACDRNSVFRELSAVPHLLRVVTALFITDIPLRYRHSLG